MQLLQVPVGKKFRKDEMQFTRANYSPVVEALIADMKGKQILAISSDMAVFVFPAESEVTLVENSK